MDLADTTGSPSSKLNVEGALSAIRDVSHALFNLGEFKKAEEIARSIVAKFESLFGNEHVNTVQERGNVARCLLQAQGIRTSRGDQTVIQMPLFCQMKSTLNCP